jgi:hypothetical protein
VARMVESINAAASDRLAWNCFWDAAPVTSSIARVCFRPSNRLAGRDSHPLKIADFHGVLVFQESEESVGLMGRRQACLYQLLLKLLKSNASCDRALGGEHTASENAPQPLT